MITARLLIPAGLLLGACTEPGTGGGSVIASTLPEKVREIAAPYQDLSTAYYKSSDGCYWYRYDGPVEVADLPLRTANGAPICTRAQSS